MSFAIAVLLSGNGSNLQAIMNAIAQHELDVVIKVVISDRLDAKGLERARDAGIPAIFIEPAKYQLREQFDDALSVILNDYHVSLVVLAGFMRILSDKFVSRYLGKLINIHPSLLPKYKGLNTHQRVIDAGELEHGASVHFVTPKLDDGPIIIQSGVEVVAGESSEQLKQKIHKIEHIIYPRAINWISKARVELKNGRVFLDGLVIDEIKHNIVI
ncbi:Phosphoribosylglycinamide formyltransferase [hydrothermal vent metagenome]|uniref:phosphoribosylglycinamide formyltransferase 1 n=1 Tax=hydrothermal vent metagenome TaxID=652676 RepID=A0A3B0ZDH1_9ZZZZ